MKIDYENHANERPQTTTPWPFTLAYLAFLLICLSHSWMILAIKPAITERIKKRTMRPPFELQGLANRDVIQFM